MPVDQDCVYVGSVSATASRFIDWSSFHNLWRKTLPDVTMQLFAIVCLRWEYGRRESSHNDQTFQIEETKILQPDSEYNCVIYIIYILYVCQHILACLSILLAGSTYHKVGSRKLTVSGWWKRGNQKGNNKNKAHINTRRVKSKSWPNETLK